MAESYVDQIFRAPSLRTIGGRLGATFAASMAAERERWGLWIPVGLGLGIALYFALMHEPQWWAGLAATTGAAAMVVAMQRVSAGSATIGALALAIVATGFTLAQWQAARVAAPAIERPLGIVAVSGVVTDIEQRDKGIRVTLMPQHIDRQKLLPRFVRLTLRREVDGLAAGDVVSLRADLMPPPGPSLPGGFDFQRQAWFEGLGGVGYGVGEVTRTAATPHGLGQIVKSLRDGMTSRIRAALPPRTGGIAAALITGERGAVPADINQDYRDSGLSHLLVIAGLHMTLVTGFVFFACRALLALFPAVALHYAIKKWAAAAALLTATAYLIISGSAIPTERAFVMVSLGFLAILVDRAHVSMRGVAWAAGIVLAVSPVALLGVSFQMSFAAVVGLVAFYETFGGRLSALRGSAGFVGRFLLLLLGIVCTTVVATIATAPFSVYHFGRLAVFSVLANLLAVPLAAFWVMPWAFASCLLMPFGLEAIGLTPMGWGIGWIEDVAHLTAGLPDAVLDLPAMPDWGLVLIAAGGLWLAIWRGKWRCWGGIPILVGWLGILAVQPPDLLISADGKVSAIRLGAAYVLSSTTTDKSETAAWLRAVGETQTIAMPQPGHADGKLRCDRSGCIWQSPAGIVAIEDDAAAIEEDCRHAVLIIARFPPGRRCRTTRTVLDKADFARDGATAIWLGPGIRIATANAERGQRPWVIGGPARRSLSSAAADPPAAPEP